MEIRKVIKIGRTFGFTIPKEYIRKLRIRDGELWETKLEDHAILYLQRIK